MIRGSTPELIFKVPLLKDSIKAIRVMVHNGALRLVKGIDDCTVVDNSISVKLTQKVNTYCFTRDELLKEDVENGIIRPSNVKLNFLLSDKCQIVKADL